MHKRIKYAMSVGMVLIAYSGANLYAQSDTIVRISNFASGMQGWQVHRIDTKVPATQFSAKIIDGVPAVQAQANKSMALLSKNIMINLLETPILCWRWRVNRVVAGADITKKSGDDQAARIYIGLDLPKEALSLGTRLKLAVARSGNKQSIPDGVINYVWDNKLPVGTTRNNVFTKQAKIIVAQSGNTAADKWVSERYNLARDIERQFKTNKARVQSIAISSDTDNSGGSVTAGFADIHFVAANRQCQF